VTTAIFSQVLTDTRSSSNPVRCKRVRGSDASTFSLFGERAVAVAAGSGTRLQELKSLLDKKLISPEEYEKKRAQILGEL
jgi:hypothetical protein